MNARVSAPTRSMTDRTNLKIEAVDFEVLDTYIVKGLKVSVLEFDVPLNYYDSKDSRTIKIVAKLATKFDSTKNNKAYDYKEDIEANKTNILVYLQGGPGHESEFPLSLGGPGYQEYLLNKSFAVLHLDQRGTGLSTALDADSIVKAGTPQEQLEYLLNFRADSIIFDCETIRKSIFKDDPLNKWSIMGQSYGGFCSTTYASFFPKSLHRAITAGGIPPLGLGADDVYIATYKRTRERNISYYKKYPQDIAKVKYIADYLGANDIKLPNGGNFTVNRFRHFGIAFGGSGGSDNLHRIIFKLYDDLKKRECFSYSSLVTVERFQSFETNILYFLFQEAIYCDGKGSKSNWAAHNNMPSDFKDDSETFFFTGEMVFPSMYEDYTELKKVKEVAELLHSYQDWTNLYDLGTLQNLTFDEVPIVAATYYADQYVDFELSKHSKDNYMSGCLRQFITSEFFHDGIRKGTTKILDQLFDLLDSEVI